MRPHRGLPSGFSLLELMVVIVIIALLLALLIPAVQRAREAGRRAQCSNNGNQIQIALLQFESSKGRLPFLVTTLPGNTPVLGAGNYVTAGWVPQILANLGRDDLYQIYASNATAAGSVFNANGPAGHMFIQYLDSLVCASDTAKPTTAIAPTKLTAPAQAPLSFAVNGGQTDIKPCTKNGIAYPPDYQENGLFYNQASSVMVMPFQVPPDDIQQMPIQIDLAYVARHDGVATTILLGENMDATFWAQYGGNPAAPASFVPFITYPLSRNALQPLGALLDYSPCHEDPQALVWLDLPDTSPYVAPGTPPIGLNQGYNGLPPGAISQLGTAELPPQGTLARPSSAHPGGFHITFADGHTIFMSQDISYQLYAELMTPRGAWARIPGSGQVAPGQFPSKALQAWQTAPVSSDTLGP